MFCNNTQGRLIRGGTGRYVNVWNTEYPSSPIDFNNNITNTSYSKSFSPMGSGSITQLGSPSMAQNLNPPLNSIALSLLRNVSGGPETSPIDMRSSRHSKLDRSMSEPIDPNSFQMAPRSHSFSSGNTNNNNDDNKSVSISSRYKTELCRTYEERGTCKYGDKCQFAHGFREMRDLTRHPKYKTELCRTFHSTGFCPYGTRCHFIHNDEESRKPRSKSYSLDVTGDLSPDLSSPSQSLSFFSEELSPNSSFQQSPSPPFNISTLSESFTFPHHDYQQKKIEQRNSFNGLTKSAYDATIAALLAQQPMGKLFRNIDDDVFQRAGLVSPVSDDHLADLSEKVKLLTLAVRLQQEGKFNNLAGTSLTEIKNFF